MSQTDKLKVTRRRRALGISSVIIGCLAGSLLLNISVAQAAPADSRPAAEGPSTSQNLKGSGHPTIEYGDDVVAADANGILWLYPHEGPRTLGSRIELGSGWKDARSIKVVDWNGDGTLDLVTQWNSGKVDVQLGLADGGFDNGPVLAESGWATAQLTIGHWLEDSKYPQIISRDPQGRLWLWKASGETLEGHQKIGTGWSGLNTVMVDFDHDGHQDLLAQNSQGKLLLYRSNGEGNFINESRPVVGTSWNNFTSISVYEGRNHRDTGLHARARDGKLYAYPLGGPSGWETRARIGSGWNSYLIAGGENINR